MNESKQIEVNSASIIDLKAELYRKQESFRLKKLSQTQQQVVENDHNLYEINFNQKYKLGKRIREKNDKELIANNKRRCGQNTTQDTKLTEEEIEVQKALKKSKEMLEKKSLLYEKLSRNPNLLNKTEEDSEEESDERILVDFHQKAYQKKTSDDKDFTEEEEEWTEFVDSLGRTRKCLKKDLEHYLNVDRQMFGHNKSEDNRPKEENRSEQSSIPQLSANNELLTDDLRRELERREWEANARNEVTNERQSEGNRSNANIHYQNVKFNEIRDHGVAYYAFDEDSTKRQQQMDLLKQLRDQTKTRKEQKQRLKQKRKQLMRERLAKVAQRKGIPFEPKESSSDSDDDFSDNEPEVPEPKHIPSAVREWDVGKKDLHEVLPQLRPKPTYNSHKTYVEERRDERISEFAPPSAYSQNQSKNNFRDKRTHFRQNFGQKSETNKSFGHNLDKTNDRIDTKSGVNIDSNANRKPDVNQVISNALSYFRNNLKQ